MAIKAIALSLSIFISSSSLSQDDNRHVRMIPDRYDGKLVLYKTYYNKYYPICTNVKFEDLTFTGQGYKIVKDKRGFFFIRIIDNNYGHMLKVFDRTEMLYEIYTYVEKKIPLPRNCIVHINSQEHSYETYIFDSLFFCPAVIPTENQDAYFDFFLGFDIPFKYQFFDLEIRHGAIVKYSERIKGNKYSKRCKDYLKNHYTLKFSILSGYGLRSSSDTLIVKNATIKDDLGNIYVLEETKVAIGEDEYEYLKKSR